MENKRINQSEVPQTLGEKVRGVVAVSSLGVAACGFLGSIVYYGFLDSGKKLSEYVTQQGPMMSEFLKDNPEAAFIGLGLIGLVNLSLLMVVQLARIEEKREAIQLALQKGEVGPVKVSTDLPSQIDRTAKVVRKILGMQQGRLMSEEDIEAQEKQDRWDN